MLKSVKYSCPECDYVIALEIPEKLIKDKREFAIPPFVCPNRKAHKDPNSPIGLNILLQF